MRSRRPYGSQNDHRYRAPYSSGSTSSATRAARGSFPSRSGAAQAWPVSVSASAFSSPWFSPWVSCDCRVETFTVSSGASLHTATTVVPAVGEGPEQRPDLGPFGLGQLQIDVVDPQQARAPDQRQRDGQPQRLQPFQIAYGGPRALGQRLQVETGGRQRGVDPQPRLGRPLGARPQQPTQGVAEVPLQQRPFVQVLPDGQRRVEVGEPGDMGQSTDAAHRRQVLRQPRPAHRRRALRRLHPPGEREQQARTPGPGRPLDGDQRAGLRVDPDPAERPAAWALEPEALGCDTDCAHSSPC